MRRLFLVLALLFMFFEFTEDGPRWNCARDGNRVCGSQMTIREAYRN